MCVRQGQHTLMQDFKYFLLSCVLFVTIASQRPFCDSQPTLQYTLGQTNVRDTFRKLYVTGHGVSAAYDSSYMITLKGQELNAVNQEHGSIEAFITPQPSENFTVEFLVRPGKLTTCLFHSPSSYDYLGCVSYILDHMRSRSDLCGGTS